MSARFADRSAAGRELAEAAARALEGRGWPEPVVLALPRGGAPLGAEVAKRLGCPLDLLLVRKIGAPGNPEVAAAAVLEGDPPAIVSNPEVMEACSLGPDDIDRLAAREREEIARRRARYLGGRAPAAIAGRTAIVVDDGAATGATMRAALAGLRTRGPEKVVAALPLASREAAALIEAEADLAVILETPSPFIALSAHYDAFPQLEDDEVIAALDAAI